MWRELRGNHSTAINGLLTTGIAAAAAYSLLSGVLVMPASQVAGLLVGGWALGLWAPTKETRAKKYRNLQGLGPALVMVLALTVTVFAIREAQHREVRESVMPKRDHAVPRFWQHGKICKYLDEF